MFPRSGSSVKNINNVSASRWHVVIKCNFPFFQESLIANSFLPNLSCVLLYSWGPFKATAGLYGSLCNAVSARRDVFWVYVDMAYNKPWGSVLSVPPPTQTPPDRLSHVLSQQSPAASQSPSACGKWKWGSLYMCFQVTLLDQYQQLRKQGLDLGSRDRSRTLLTLSLKWNYSSGRDKGGNKVIPENSVTV